MDPQYEASIRPWRPHPHDQGNEAQERRGSDSFVHAPLRILDKMWRTKCCFSGGYDCREDANMAEMFAKCIPESSVVLQPTSHVPYAVPRISSSSVPSRSWRVSMGDHKGDEGREYEMDDGFLSDELVLADMVGEGAHGTVYRGYLNGKMVAVKKMCRRFQNGSHHYVDPETICASLRRLQGTFHPNLVGIYSVRTVAEDFGVPRRSSASISDTGLSSRYSKSLQACVVMEFCDQGTLWDAIQRGVFRNGEVPASVDYFGIMDIALQVAFAMRHMHKLNIIHGNLKAENIMLQSSESPRMSLRAKVGGFGLCRRADSNSLTSAAFSWGTLDHMAPEMLQEGILCSSADVFSFAMLLIELIIGECPFRSMTTSAIVLAICQGMRPEIPRCCPQHLTRLIKRCWHQNWRRRPAFHDIVDYLLDYMSSHYS